MVAEPRRCFPLPLLLLSPEVVAEVVLQRLRQGVLQASLAQAAALRLRASCALEVVVAHSYWVVLQGQVMWATQSMPLRAQPGPLRCRAGREAQAVSLARWAPLQAAPGGALGVLAAVAAALMAAEVAAAFSVGVAGPLAQHPFFSVTRLTLKTQLPHKGAVVAADRRL